MFISPIACVYKSALPLDLSCWDKKIPCTKNIFCTLHYGFSRQFADYGQVVEAIFDDNFGFSDEENRESDDGNDICGYLGHAIISRAEIIDAA